MENTPNKVQESSEKPPDMFCMNRGISCYSTAQNGLTLWYRLPGLIRNTERMVLLFCVISGENMSALFIRKPVMYLCSSSLLLLVTAFPSVLWHSLFSRKEQEPSVKSWVLVCWCWQFDCSFARVISPAVTTIPSSLAPIKLANPGSPGENGH